MPVARPLDLFTLHNAAAYYAEEFPKPSLPNPAHPERMWVGGRGLIMNNLVNAGFKDEFNVLVERMDDILENTEHRDDWHKAQASTFTPRRDDVFEEELAKHLAIYPDGVHIPGKIGLIQIGTRRLGREAYDDIIRAPRTMWDVIRFRAGKIVYQKTGLRNAHWPMYAGELEERFAESGLYDVLPEGAEPYVESVHANNPKMSNVAAVLAADVIATDVDSGSTAGEIRGRVGTQPADVDATESGVLLFTLPMSDPAFLGASDDTGKATTTADTITSDTSAAATGTVGYCRIAATGAGADDVLDGEAGATSGFDINFNTDAIVMNSTVAMTALTLSVSE